MTTRPGPRPAHVSYDDLQPTEYEQVAALERSVDLDGLAADMGTEVAQLLEIRRLSPIRGTFRTPWPLLAAVSGHGFAGPAASRGEVLRRLGLSDSGGFRRLREAADWFGIDLPETAKDGARLGAGKLRDEALVRRVHGDSVNVADFARRMGMSVCGVTFKRIRARFAELGLPDLTGRGERTGARKKTA